MLGLPVLIFAGGPMGSLIGLLLAERVGRRWGLIWFSLAGIVMSTLYVGVTDTTLIAAFGFCVTLVIYVLSSLSITCYVSELFPTEVRLRGGVANAAGRAVNIVVPHTIAASFESFSLYGVPGLITVAPLLQTLVLFVTSIETKQRSLEDLGVGAEPAVSAALRQS